MKTISVQPHFALWLVLLLTSIAVCSSAKERSNISELRDNANQATLQELDGMMWDKDSVYVKYFDAPHLINTSKWHRVAKFKTDFNELDYQYWTDDSCLYLFSWKLRWVDFLRKPFKILPDSIIMNGNHLITNSVVLELDTLNSYERVDGGFLLINGEYYIQAMGRLMNKRQYEEYLKSYYNRQNFEKRKKNFPQNCELFTLILFVILIIRNRKQGFNWAFSTLTPLCYLPALIGIFFCLFELFYDPGAELGLLLCFPAMAFFSIILFVTWYLIHRKKKEK